MSLTGVSPMTENSPDTLQLVLTDREGLGQITVPMEAFFDFSFSIAEDLEDLVATWRILAAPRSERWSPLDR